MDNCLASSCGCIKLNSAFAVRSVLLSIQSNKFFEDAFKVYERGVQIFKYPHVREIWTTYLVKFVGRYGEKKLERARDLFEQAVEKVCITHFLSCIMKKTEKPVPMFES